MIKILLKKIYNRILIVPLNTFRKIFYYFDFLQDYQKFKKKSSVSSRFNLKFLEQYPCLLEKTANSSFEPHYTYHLAWAARILSENKPTLHIDISSGLTFSTIVSAFIPIRFYDYRPADIRLSNFSSGKADVTNLPFSDNNIGSLSCMHVIEHIGLGRYGDELDPDGDIRGINELKRVLSPGGKLLFVVPVGKPVIRFNAHRIYSYEQIIKYFDGLKLLKFDLLPDDYNNGLIQNSDAKLVSEQKFGCGCFLFTK